MDLQLDPRQAMPPRHQSPPYPPQGASLGGVPNFSTDVPVTAVFLFFYILGAIAHMTIFQINQRRGHKFIMSGMMFGFCMARITTCVMRIIWACRQTNVRIAIAAQIFVAAGVVLLFVVNLIFAQRIIRAAHPHSGWHPAMAWFFRALYIIIVLSLIMLITCVVDSFYTLNKNSRRIDRDVQLYGQTYYAVVSFLPIPLVVFGLIIPRKTRVEKFGSGRFRSKIHILIWASFLLCLGAAFRCGTNYKNARPRNDPAWYQSKACFYIFNFAVEVIVIFLYVVVRVDKRFWVPNGSKTAGDYSRKEVEAEKTGDDNFGIMPEEEVFDDETPEQVRSKDKVRDEEAGRAAAV